MTAHTITQNDHRDKDRDSVSTTVMLCHKIADRSKTLAYAKSTKLN